MSSKESHDKSSDESGVEERAFPLTNIWKRRCNPDQGEEDAAIDVNVQLADQHWEEMQLRDFEVPPGRTKFTDIVRAVLSLISHERKAHLQSTSLEDFSPDDIEFFFRRCPRAIQALNILKSRIAFIEYDITANMPNVNKTLSVVMEKILGISMTRPETARTLTDCLGLSLEPLTRRPVVSFNMQNDEIVPDIRETSTMLGRMRAIREEALARTQQPLMAEEHSSNQQDNRPSFLGTAARITNEFNSPVIITRRESNMRNFSMFLVYLNMRRLRNRSYNSITLPTGVRIRYDDSGVVVEFRPEILPGYEEERADESSDDKPADEPENPS